MQKEERFWETLKDIFIGEKIDGDSGFVNLMKIKSSYFDVVFKELEHEIKEATADYPDFREELYDKLFSFFKRYFSESGSIYFTYTPLKEQVYEKVYTNVDDVTLFWKTHMLYYVKTDHLWREMTVKTKDNDGAEWTISFDVSEMQHKQANERRRLIFELKEYDKDGMRLAFKVLYAKGGRKTKVDQMVKELAKNNIALNEETIEQAISMFLRQNEVDFFINKDAEGFLKEQFDLWLFKDYLMDLTSVFDEARLGQIKFLRSVAYKLIEFVAMFEEELKKIWNKPKAVSSSNYVFTLDRLISFEGGMDLLERILKEDGFEKQVEEWKELAVVDDDFTIDSLFSVNVYGERYITEDWKFLCIDTKHFDSKMIEELLQLVVDHDEELDGWVIHSENYQVLRTLNSRFKDSVAIIYIDPPYNTGQDGFPYKDRFMHASWLSMMHDRLMIAKEFLQPEGMIFVSIDDNEQPNLRIQMDKIFHPDNYLAVISWEKRYTRSNNAKLFYTVKDYLVTYRKSNRLGLIRESRTEESDARYTNPDNDPRGPWKGTWYVNPATKEQRPNLVYPIMNPHTGAEVNHPTRAWKYSLEENQRHVEENLLYWGVNGESQYPQLKVFLSEVGNLVPVDIWDYKTTGTTDDGSIQLFHLFGKKIFDNPKPASLVERIGSLIVNNTPISSSVFLDFFAGSGTTAQAVMKLNKDTDSPKNRFMLIEMADYVYDIIIPRLKKYAFSNEWKEGRPKNVTGQSLFFKYYKLEQYEDVLSRTLYRESHPLQYEGIDSTEMIHSYLFLDDRKLLDAVNAEGDDIEIDLKRVYPDIDMAETLANLRGKMIKRITTEGVKFEDGEYISFAELKFSQVRELIWW